MSATTTTRHWLIGLGFLAAYVALDYVSYVKPYRDVGITPWNPPAGLAIAFVFLEGLPIVPFVLVAPLLADALVRQIPLPLAADVLGSLLVGSTFVAAGLTLQRMGHFDPRFRKVRDVLTLVAVAASTAILAAGILVALFLATGLFYARGADRHVEVHRRRHDRHSHRCADGAAVANLSALAGSRFPGCRCSC